MIHIYFKTSILLPLVLLLYSCILPTPHLPRDLTFITEKKVKSVAIKSTPRKDIINELGRPLRYRKHEISYLVCREKGGISWGEHLPEWQRDTIPTDILGDIECSEFILKFDSKDKLMDLSKIPSNWSANEGAELEAEDLYLRKLANQGDPVAQLFWKTSRTYYTSQRKDIVEERNKDEFLYNERKLELEDKLKPSAEAGDMKAQFELFFLEDKSSMKWLCRAADQGYVPAQKYIAHLFETGDKSVHRDYAQAYVWYRRLAVGANQQMLEKMIKVLERKGTKSTYCYGKGDQCHLAMKIVEMKIKLGSEGVTRAEVMFQQWKPGDCEAEFSSTEYETGTE